VLHADLRAACLGALDLSRAACRAFALTRGWETSARQFIGHVGKVASARRPFADYAVEPTASLPSPARR
jgi:hypothetical protein